MENIENSAMIQEMSKALKDEAEKRTKHILKRTIPRKRSLKNALLSFNRQELDDIRYNVGMSGTSSLKKAELVDKMVPCIIDFARTWFVSIFDEQYQAFLHLISNKGICSDFRDDEMRLDYFQSIGLLANGSKNGKVAWYVPEEIIAEFNKLNNDSFKKIVEANTEILQIATGLLFYYGVMDSDKLFVKTKKYYDFDDNFSKNDFLKILFNGSCWEQQIMSNDKYVFYRSVFNPDDIYAEQQNIAVGYANIPYDEVFEAGVPNYIDATPAFKAISQFFMNTYDKDVIEAAAITSKISYILQNNGQMKEVVALLDKLGLLKNEKYNSKIVSLLKDYYNSMRLWKFKGHTPYEFISGKIDLEQDASETNIAGIVGKKVGRNDPCPCGSGKKYKKCCMAKDLAQN